MGLDSLTGRVQGRADNRRPPWALPQRPQAAGDTVVPVCVPGRDNRSFYEEPTGPAPRSRTCMRGEGGGTWAGESFVNKNPTCP